MAIILLHQLGQQLKPKIEIIRSKSVRKKYSTHKLDLSMSNLGTDQKVLRQKNIADNCLNSSYLSILQRFIQAQFALYDFVAKNTSTRKVPSLQVTFCVFDVFNDPKPQIQKQFTQMIL